MHSVNVLSVQNKFNMKYKEKKDEIQTEKNICNMYHSLRDDF